MKINTTHLPWVDIVRVVAMFGVVLLHVAAPLLYKFGDISLSYWWVANIYDTAVRVCVPLFFMISGYLLLGKKEPILIFLKKRLIKVIIPLIVWSVIYILWKSYVIGNGDISFSYFLKAIISPVETHLWFLYVIIGIYFYVPILRIIVQNSKIKHLYYFIVLWIISVSFIPFLEKLWATENHIDLLMISGYGGYFVLGYILGKINLSKKWFFVSFFVIIALIGFTAYGTFYLSDGDNEFNGYLYEYLSLNIILCSTTAFILIKYLFDVIIIIKSKIILKSIRTLSSASLGIYLIHPILLYYLENNNLGFSLSALSGNPILFIPITTVIVFSLSFVVIWTLQKIPLIKYCAP